MRKLLTSITFGICCILSWVTAGMILEEEKGMVKQQEVVMETLQTDELESSSKGTLRAAMRTEKDLEKEQL